MTMHVRVSGVWKEITDPQVNVSGTWKGIQQGYERVAGVWKKFYERFSLFLEPTGYNIHSFSTTTSESLLRLETNGELITAINGSESSRTDAWGRPLEASVGDDYECRLTKSSGTDPVTGPALATWHALTSNRQWVWTRSVDGITDFVGTLEVRKVGTGTPSASCTIDVECAVTG